jgi:hypothetical protein
VYWAAAELEGSWRRVAFRTEPQVLVAATTADIAAEALARNAQAALKVDKTVAQAAELSNTPVFEVQPSSGGAPAFQVQMQSFANPGDGAGTFNRGVWFGFNAGRFAGGDWTEGAPGIYMGFEQNYFDAGGDEGFGVEWYVGYLTPDGSTIGPAELRPFYCRVQDSDVDSAVKNVLVSVDVGQGSSGSFSIMGDVNTQTQLFVVHKTLGIFNRLPAYFTADNADAGGAGSVQIAPADGYAQLDIIAPGVGVAGGYSIVAFKDTLTYRWTVQGTTGSFEIKDTTNGRVQLQLIPGASVNGSAFIVSAATRFDGAVGFNGAAAAGKQTLGAAATDAATTQTLANNLRNALITLGLGQT